MGVRFRGYVVPDTQCEWALQNAIERFRGMETSLASFVTPVGVFSVSLLWGRYSNFALTVLTITLMVSGIVTGSLRISQVPVAASRVKTPPSIREVVEAKNWQLAQHETGVVEECLSDLNRLADEAVDKLAGM